MSILIKDMEIPKGCNNCNFQCFTEWGGDSPYTNEIATKCLVTDKFVFPSDSERDVNCPLISIPPQGRMIDVDVLLKKVYKLRMWLLENNMPGAEHWVTKVYQMIDEVADGGKMTVIDKKPVPIYEVECFECHSIIHYKKCEISNCFIECPVCNMSIMVTALHPVFYESEEENECTD